MKKKGLQKFTDIKSKDDLDSFMIVNSKINFNEVFSYLAEFANKIDLKEAPEEWQKAAELLMYCSEKYGPKETYENVRNTLYQHNHQAIIKSLHNMVINGTMPSTTSIATETGMSRTTVHKHLKDIQNEGSDSETRLHQRALAEHAMTMLYRIGVEQSNPTALKHFIQFSGLKNNLTTVNNYVQINNIRLTQKDISSLPVELLEKVEKLLRK